MSNAAALRIVAVSTDVLFNMMEDVFITGVCRAVAGIGCTSIPGIYQSEATACDVISGRVKNIPYVNSVQRTRLWNFVRSDAAAERTCGERIATWYIVVTCVILSSIIYCFSVCRRRKLFSVLLLQKL